MVTMRSPVDGTARPPERIDGGYVPCAPTGLEIILMEEHLRRVAVS